MAPAGPLRPRELVERAHERQQRHAARPVRRRAAPPTLPSPRPATLRRGVRPSARLPVASALSEPAGARVAAPAGAGPTSASSASDLACRHERDVQRPRLRSALRAAPPATVCRCRRRLIGEWACVATLGVRVHVPQRARRSVRLQLGVRARCAFSDGAALARFDHRVHARFAADHDELVDHRERVAARGRPGRRRPRSCSRARPRATPAWRRTTRAFARSLVSSTIAPCAPPDAERPARRSRCPSIPAGAGSASASRSTPSEVKNRPAFGPSHGATSRLKSSVGEPGVCSAPSRRRVRVALAGQRVPGRERFGLEAAGRDAPPRPRTRAPRRGRSRPGRRSNRSSLEPQPAARKRRHGDVGVRRSAARSASWAGVVMVAL